MFRFLYGEKSISVISHLILDTFPVERNVDMGFEVQLEEEGGGRRRQSCINLFYL